MFRFGGFFQFFVVVFCFILFFCILPDVAQADLLRFEPTYGVEFGNRDLTLETTSGTTTTTTELNSISYAGVSVGFKFGFPVDYLLLAMSFRGLAGQSKDTTDGTSATVHDIAAGAGLGWEWNLPMRTYIGFETSISGGSDQPDDKNSIGIAGTYLELSYLAWNYTFSYAFKAGGLTIGGIEYAGSSHLLSMSTPWNTFYPDTWSPHQSVNGGNYGGANSTMKLRKAHHHKKAAGHSNSGSSQSNSTSDEAEDDEDEDEDEEEDLDDSAEDATEDETEDEEDEDE